MQEKDALLVVTPDGADHVPVKEREEQRERAKNGIIFVTVRYEHYKSQKIPAGQKLGKGMCKKS
jgi:hypothetical protein